MCLDYVYVVCWYRFACDCGFAICVLLLLGLFVILDLARVGLEGK